MRKNKTLRVGAAILGLALVAAACADDDDNNNNAGSSVATTETSTNPTDTAVSTPASTPAGPATCEGIALGFFGALTGANANLGINIKNGAELRIEQFNEANPDCQIELKEFDSQGSPDQAPALAKQAIDDESIVGIIGPAFSGESRAANPAFDEAGLPIVTASATAVDLSEQGWKIFHRMLGNDGAQGPAAAKYIKDTLKAGNVFVVDDGTEYGKGLADLVKKDLGDLVKGSDQVQEKQTDFAATVTAVKDAEPDALFYGGYYAEAGPFIKQLRDAGVEVPFVTGDGVKDPGFVEAAGTAAEGAIITCPCAPPESFPEFLSAYKEKFGSDPQTYGAEAYDAATAFVTLIGEGKVTRADILAGLSTLDIPGVTKQIKWDEKGEGADQTVYAYTVKDGAIVAVGAIK